jgi:NAD(P)-dependent dehydrogenase (short-subunit alcohol dehydrogenase family)
MKSPDMIDLHRKTILVTGASRGIGAALYNCLSAAGAEVIPHASRPSDLTDDRFLYQDLSQAKAGGKLFAAALEKYGKIDAVVNNAGVYLPSPIAGNNSSLDTGSNSGWDSGWESGWETTIAVNIQAPADICRAAITHFKETGGGDIINIASRAGHRGDGVDHAAYAASKGAILAMTKTWARALSGENIHLYAIAPGWVETRMAPQDIENRKKAVADIPLGRVAQPDEIANMAAFLLSGACPSAVGATFDINGASYVR